jgi:hypothetical protein
MGLLTALFTSKSRMIREYRFVDIAEDVIAPHIAQKFKEMLDSTKSFGWDSDEFFWHIYDNSSGISEKSRIAFNAKYLKEDSAGNKIYVDSGDTGSGDRLFFIFSVAPSNNALYLNVQDDSDNNLFTIFIILRK